MLNALRPDAPQILRTTEVRHTSIHQTGDYTKAADRVCDAVSLGLFRSSQP
jgi:hypothetical protein